MSILNLTALPVRSHLFRCASERCMCVNSRRLRNALTQGSTKRYLLRTYAASRRTSCKSDVSSDYHLESDPTADSVGLYGENHIGYRWMQPHRKDDSLHNEKPRTLSEWLDSCCVNLHEHEVRWPPDELDQLPDLRFQPKQTSGQCIAWQLFKDDRAAHLPSFQELIPRLDVDSCRDSWFLEKPIKLKEDRFEDFKAHLLDETVAKIRLLNVPVTKRVVSRRSQHQHSTMVRERVKHFYDVGDDHFIEVHDATINVTPRGTATEIHHDSDPHISTACGESGASSDQPMKLWLLWHASESRGLATCYSDTAAALRRLRPCGYLVQYSGESLMLPANVPHAALSLSPHHLYGQSFHVEGRARDPTTLELELSACAKPSEAIGNVLMCYEEGLQDSNPQIRAIHIDHAIRTLASEKTTLPQANTDLYVSKVVEVLRRNRMFKGVCGLCEHLKLSPLSDIDCWGMHDIYVNKLHSRDRA